MLCLTLGISVSALAENGPNESEDSFAWVIMNKVVGDERVDVAVLYDATGEEKTKEGASYDRGKT